jgi:Protein of unknown function (DUF3618)
MTTAKDPEQIQREIEETRRELGDTVEALAAKADVKAQVHSRIQSAKAWARSHPAPLAAVGVGLVGLVAWRVIKRRRS